jgi:hypothetical protein
LRDIGSNELSRRAGLNESYVSSAETGRRKDFEAAPIQALARVLRIRSEWLLEGEEPMEGSSSSRAPKPNLERCLERNPNRWLPIVIAGARAAHHDRPVAKWETVLDQLQTVVAPVAAQNAL